MAASNLATAKAMLYSLPDDLLVVFGCLVVFGALRVLHACRSARSRRHRLGEAIETAADYAESGQLAMASELLADTARAKSETGIYAQAALGNLHLRRGHFGHAVGMFTCLIRTTPRSKERVRRSLEDSLAYVLAAAGDLEFAEHFWSVTSRQSDPTSPLGCLLLCRRGRFSDIVSPTGTRGSSGTAATVDPGFDWHAERVVALLSAFAHAQDPDKDPNQAPALQYRLDELVEAARPTYPGEYDYLQRAWPELRSFVEGQGAKLEPKRSHHLRVNIPWASVVSRHTPSEPSSVRHVHRRHQVGLGKKTASFPMALPRIDTLLGRRQAGP